MKNKKRDLRRHKQDIRLKEIIKDEYHRALSWYLQPPRPWEMRTYKNKAVPFYHDYYQKQIEPGIYATMLVITWEDFEEYVRHRAKKSLDARASCSNFCCGNIRRSYGNNKIALTQQEQSAIENDHQIWEEEDNLPSILRKRRKTPR